MKHSFSLAALLAASAAFGCRASERAGSSHGIHIDGAVARVGDYPCSAGLTAFEALALAGPTLSDADLSRVELRRTVQGETQTFVLDLARMQEVGDSSSNILVLAGDAIHVPSVD